MTTSTTNYTYITNWNAIAHMTFAGNAHQLNADRTYIPDGQTLFASYGRKRMSFPQPSNPVWSDEAIEKAKETIAFQYAVAEHKQRWVDKCFAAYAKHQPLPHFKRANLTFTYQGRSLPKPERQPILPLTPEQEAARIARNRAKLGLD